MNRGYGLANLKACGELQGTRAQGLLLLQLDPETVATLATSTSFHSLDWSVAWHHVVFFLYNKTHLAANHSALEVWQFNMINPQTRNDQSRSVLVLDTSVLVQPLAQHSMLHVMSMQRKSSAICRGKNCILGSAENEEKGMPWKDGAVQCCPYIIWYRIVSYFVISYHNIFSIFLHHIIFVYQTLQILQIGPPNGRRAWR